MRSCCFALLVLLLLPASALSEVWDFSCTEAVTLLKAVQERVVQKHDRLQEAKFSLRHTPKKYAGCPRSRLGLQGGEMHCVAHQSKQGILLREILAAQRSLDASLQEFDKRQKELSFSCTLPLP